jgi:hypothetical protein
MHFLPHSFLFAATREWVSECGDSARVAAGERAAWWARNGAIRGQNWQLRRLDGPEIGRPTAVGGFWVSALRLRCG